MKRCIHREHYKEKRSPEKRKKMERRFQTNEINFSNGVYTFLRKKQTYFMGRPDELYDP
jgi:hypothetical protein